MRTDTDRAKIARAFRRIDEMGGRTLTGHCCQTCGWAEIGEVPDDVPVAHFNVQSEESAFGGRGENDLVRTLHVHHAGPSDKIVEALKAEGLTVEWDGDASKSIKVVPASVH